MGIGEDLYSQYLKGDPAAFDRVIELYRKNLIFFLLRYLPILEDAEDAAEDAFVELLLHRYREKEGASLKTYLFTIGRNKALNLLKHQKYRVKLWEGAEANGTDASFLEEHLLRDEKKRELSRALDSLPADYREALHLLYFEDLSYLEAGAVMKKSKKQVENLSYRAKKALREKLGKEDLFCENQ